jgi:hypothetical protein
VNGPNSLQVRPAQRLTAPDGTEANIDIVPFVQAPSLSRLLNLHHRPSRLAHISGCSDR